MQLTDRLTRALVGAMAMGAVLVPATVVDAQSSEPCPREGECPAPRPEAAPAPADPSLPAEPDFTG